MLVLTRMMGEEIRIGDDVVIMVFEAEEGRVALGVTAPADVPVWREEPLRKDPAGGDATPSARGPSRRRHPRP